MSSRGVPATWESLSWNHSGHQSHSLWRLEGRRGEGRNVWVVGFAQLKSKGYFILKYPCNRRWSAFQLKCTCQNALENIPFSVEYCKSHSAQHFLPRGKKREKKGIKPTQWTFSLIWNTADFKFCQDSEYNHSTTHRTQPKLYHIRWRHHQD